MTLTRRNLLVGTAAIGSTTRLNGEWLAGSQSAGDDPRRGRNGSAGPEWVKHIYREVHLDAHFGQFPRVYEDFDANGAAEILRDAGFQMVSYFAGCGAGYSYYPSKLGVVHPGLKRDFTGEMTTALKKRGIRAMAYVSVGADRRFHKEHPDWVIARDAKGQKTEIRDGAAQICLNSPWIDDVHIPHLKEILSLYDVDAFFLDGLLGKFWRGPCYCRYCRETFKQEVGGEIPLDDHDPLTFAHHQWMAHRMSVYAERVLGALLGTKPSLTFVLNHLWVTRTPVNPPRVMSQLVWEPVPPYPGVHSLDFSLEARYLSNVPAIANWSCMATRGNGWGDYSLRDSHAFQHEAAVLLASGGRPFWGDDSYASGNPDPAVYRVFGDVNHHTRELEASVESCAPVKDVGVLLSARSIWAELPLVPPREWMGRPASASVAGAHKILTEEHVQFSLLNSDELPHQLPDFRALILPEQCILSSEECAAIRRFVNGGGALVVTGSTGTRSDKNGPLPDFALSDVLGVRYVERVEARRAYLRMGGDTERFQIPRMDVQVSGSYSRIQLASAQKLVDLVPPSGPKQAPGGVPEGPGITIHQFGKGKAIYCALPLFEAYFETDTPSLREIAAWMLHLVYPQAARTIALENAPLNVEVVYNLRGKNRHVHLVNFNADKRMSGAPRVQDFVVASGIRVGFQCAERPRRISRAQQKSPVEFTWKDGWVWFQAAPLTLHDLYVIEA